jgi:hypothetical protein
VINSIAGLTSLDSSPSTVLALENCMPGAIEEQPATTIAQDIAQDSATKYLSL